MIIELPWPYKGLSPNERPNRYYLASQKKKYRKDCYYLCLKLRELKLEPPVRFEITFHPTRKGWDQDNMIAAFKAGQDGLADALGIDDKNFQMTRHFGEPIKGGKIILKF